MHLCAYVYVHVYMCTWHSRHIYIFSQMLIYIVSLKLNDTSSPPFLLWDEWSSELSMVFKTTCQWKLWFYLRLFAQKDATYWSACWQRTSVKYHFCILNQKFLIRVMRQKISCSYWSTWKLGWGWRAHVQVNFSMK